MWKQRKINTQNKFLTTTDKQPIEVYPPPTEKHHSIVVSCLKPVKKQRRSKIENTKDEKTKSSKVKKVKL